MNGLARRFDRHDLNSIFDAVDYGFGRSHFDVWEGDEPYQMSIAIPGVESDNIDITLNGRTLEIKAETGQYKYGYSLSMPRHGDIDGVSATYKNGILTIVVERSESTKPKKIKVK